MKIKITKKVPEWNKHKINAKKCVIVEFENQHFRWMPTYQQLEDIENALKDIERESWNAKN